MSSKTKSRHQAEIVAQFSRQAVPFAQVPGHYDALQILLELSGVGGDDAVLDVACGPGLVACAFARQARQVTGIDITPAMIEQAQKRQREQKLANLEWAVGEAVPLPYADATFSLVITRYSFHHLLAPERALAEMIRVCRPGGRVLVADIAVAPEKSAAYDRLEILRDPSHTHALTRDELAELFAHSGLVDCRQGAYGGRYRTREPAQGVFPQAGRRGGGAGAGDGGHWQGPAGDSAAKGGGAGGLHGADCCLCGAKGVI
jgi:ubiquinone/menaquinone biosynthesis C-methylase UbiE